LCGKTVFVAIPVRTQLSGFMFIADPMCAGFRSAVWESSD